MRGEINRISHKEHKEHKDPEGPLCVLCALCGQTRLESERYLVATGSRRAVQ